MQTTVWVFGNSDKILCITNSTFLTFPKVFGEVKPNIASELAKSNSNNSKVLDSLQLKINYLELDIENNCFFFVGPSAISPAVGV